MTADMFRQLYDYHFSENRKIWDRYIVPLSQEQFIAPHAYSIGSLRNHIVHMISADNAWLSELQGRTEPIVSFLGAEENDRALIRQYGDTVETMMRDYLGTLSDDMLPTKPIVLEDTADMTVWQALWHVVNHATDHRAQVLRLLNDMGIETGAQDYVFHVLA
jgi:uncharacterized damage-inducible protein DinB